MRSIVVAALFGCSLLPAAAMAQASPQTAAIESAAAPTPSPRAGGVTRDEYLQRAQERAGQRAAARFDQMDANHDGVLDRAERRAWRVQHPRRGAVQPTQPAPQ